MELFIKNLFEEPKQLNLPNETGNIPIICGNDYLNAIQYWCNCTSIPDVYCWEHAIIEKINKNEDGIFDFSKDIIDIGAGIGEYCWLTNFNHAYAFEPCKSIRFLCEANILMHNKVDNVDVFDCGISNENTTSYFNGWQLNTLPERDLETTCPLKAKEVTKGNIQLRTLDSFNFTNVGLIKIDIEGHELEALQGMIGTLVRNDYPPILIEIWTEDVYVEIQGELGRKRHEDLLKLIDDLGYDIDWWYGDWETYLCKHRSHNYTQQEDSQE